MESGEGNKNQCSNENFILYPEDNRLTTFPIFRQELFNFYKKATDLYWTVSEVPLDKDHAQYEQLTLQEKNFINYILAFFAASDGLVNVNLVERFKKEVPILEAGYFYDFQVTMENVHAHMYSLLLDTLVEDAQLRDKLLSAVETMPIIKKIGDFIRACISSDEPFAARLIRMACVEGILFTGCFCGIYWFHSRGLLPGLTLSNEYIARDEALHTQFALYLYLMIKEDKKISRDKIYKILNEAVDLAIEFISEAIPEPMITMNAKKMSDYIRNQADILLSMIDMPILYSVEYDFPFMTKINYENKVNFFERRNSDYSKPKSPGQTIFSFNCEF